MTPVSVIRGDGPVILAQPHSGTLIPPEIEARLNRRGLARVDTDWHVDRLYDGLLTGLTTVRANFHRYVIDANRDPTGASLYPGQKTTGLVPLVDFEGEDIWSAPPGNNDIERRRADFHAVYHRALAEEINRVRTNHGIVMLYDCHSIRSRLPYLFEGTLPDLNIGTDNGATCASEIEEAVAACCAVPNYSHILNGRFRGGWTIRHYGNPANGVHAVQMEIAQRAYLTSEDPPFTYSVSKARRLRLVLKNVLERIEYIAIHGKLDRTANG